MDFLQTDLNEMLVNDGITSPERAVLVSADGAVIAYTADGGENMDVENIRAESAVLPLSAAADSILSQTEGLLKLGDKEDGYYISFNTIDSTGWRLCVLSPISKIIAPVEEIRGRIEENTEKISNTVADGIRVIIDFCLVFFAVIVLLITFFTGRVSSKITEPLKLLEHDVKEISQGNFEQRTAVDTKDEIGSLARAFNGMTSSLQHYISDLTEATAREERISSELTLATQIQADALPTQYPAFPERDEFDLYFTMRPAKEVGGDFYDYFLIDESHLGIVMADVSGKGVPAALFMMISKILIKNRSLLGGTPGEILTFVNDQLYESNKVDMFVTVWLGILDLKTGLLTASNAGHEYPVLRRGNAPFEMLKDRHGFVLAGMEGSRYRDYEVKLAPGDSLFLYTDGVPEATNAEGELFGPDRMLRSLNQTRSRDCKEIIEAVYEGVSDFVGEAPQFDDITMLCLRLDKLMA